MTLVYVLGAYPVSLFLSRRHKLSWQGVGAVKTGRRERRRRGDAPSQLRGSPRVSGIDWDREQTVSLEVLGRKRVCRQRSSMPTTFVRKETVLFSERHWRGQGGSWQKTERVCRCVWTSKVRRWPGTKRLDAQGGREGSLKCVQCAVVEARVDGTSDRGLRESGVSGDDFGSGPRVL